MPIRVFAGPAGEYYVSLPRMARALHWCLVGDNWESAVGSLPAGLAEVQLTDLPAALQEEVLASVARAEALHAQLGPERN